MCNPSLGVQLIDLDLVTEISFYSHWNTGIFMKDKNIFIHIVTRFHNQQLFGVMGRNSHTRSDRDTRTVI